MTIYCTGINKQLRNFSFFCVFKNEILSVDLELYKQCKNYSDTSWQEIGEIVRYSCDRQKNKNSAPSQTVTTAQIAPKVCNGQPPTFGLQSSKFHPNRFTFGGVKAVKTRLKVSSRLGEAIVSRRVLKINT